MFNSYLVPVFLIINLFYNYGVFCSNRLNNEIDDVEEFGIHYKRNVKNYDSQRKQNINFDDTQTQLKIFDEILEELEKQQEYEDYLEKINLKLKNGAHDRSKDPKNLRFEISSENDGKARQESVALSEGAIQSQGDAALKQVSSFKSDQAPVDVLKINLNNEQVDNHDMLLLKPPPRKASDFLFYSILIGCVIAGLVVVVATGFCLYAMHKSKNLNVTGDYPQTFNDSKVQSKSVMRNGDKGLAHSAQMYHYQHQKQQMIAMEKANDELKPDQSDNSEGETDEGDYTVYECPGLAPTGEMEVKNPLFKEEYGPASNNTNEINDETVKQSSETEKAEK